MAGPPGRCQSAQAQGREAAGAGAVKSARERWGRCRFCQARAHRAQARALGKCPDLTRVTPDRKTALPSDFRPATRRPRQPGRWPGCGRRCGGGRWRGEGAGSGSALRSAPENCPVDLLTPGSARRSPLAAAAGPAGRAVSRQSPQLVRTATACESASPRSETGGLAHDHAPRPNCALMPPMKVASSCMDRAAMRAAASAPAV